MAFRRFEQGEAVELIGDFEYSNVFGEYCCEPFRVDWDPTLKELKYTNLSVPRGPFCAHDIHNICAVKGEWDFPGTAIRVSRTSTA